MRAARFQGLVAVVQRQAAGSDIHKHEGTKKQ